MTIKDSISTRLQNAHLESIDLDPFSKKYKKCIEDFSLSLYELSKLVDYHDGERPIRFFSLGEGFRQVSKIFNEVEEHILPDCGVKLAEIKTLINECHRELFGKILFEDSKI